MDDTVPSNVATIPGHSPEEIGEFRVPLISIFSNEYESFKTQETARPGKGRSIVGNSGEAAKVVG